MVRDMQEERRFQELQDQARALGIAEQPNQLLRVAAQRYTHAPALILADQTTISFNELFAQACRMQAWGQSHGIAQDNKVVLIVENSIFFYAVYYGIWQTGATLVPLNTFFTDDEATRICAHTEPACVIISSSLKSRYPTVCATYQTWTEDAITSSLPESAASHDPNSHRIAPLQSDTPAVILYTSGTTGTPKGVMLSAHSIVFNMLQGLSRFAFTEHERVLCPLPLFHSFPQNTCVWGCMFIGATVILVPKISRSSLIAAIQQKPTIVTGIPGLYGLLCKFSEISFPHVRYFVSGGDALAPNIRRFFALRFGRKLCNGYGLTEAGPTIAVDLRDTWNETHAIGRPLPGIQIDIRDAQDGIGVLWIKGENIMMGYYKNPEATDTVIQNGWLNTGDYVRCDQESGALIICGREKELIKHKGMKIYPQEIETIITQHPAVLLAAVVGHTEGDEEYPVAHIQCMPNARVTEAELRAWCSQHLAAYKTPRTYTIHERLPMTPTGKVNKKELR